MIEEEPRFARPHCGAITPSLRWPPELQMMVRGRERKKQEEGKVRKGGRTANPVKVMKPSLWAALATSVIEV